MTLQKRLFDIFFSLIIFIMISPAFIILCAIIYLVDGGPVFYVSERMNKLSSGFHLVKFRTMKTSSINSGVSGGDKAGRITKTGAYLRRSRLDELPQLWNILRGDVSFVGPRPPLREYVVKYPLIYSQVLKSRPGVTGLASVLYHKHEEFLLSQTKTPEETDSVYCNICIPKKAHIDLIYQKNQNMCFDLQIMFKTIFKSSRLIWIRTDYLI